MTNLAGIGADLHADPDFASDCTVTAPGVAVVATTVRAVNSQATDPNSRTRKADRLSCFLYLLTSAVDRPPKSTAVVIAGTSPYAGTWLTVEAGEPTSGGEWRCPAVRETTGNLITPNAGSRRRPT